MDATNRSNIEPGSDAAILLDEVAALLGCLSRDVPSGQALAWAGLAPVVWLCMQLSIGAVRVTRRTLLATIRAALAIYVAGRKAGRCYGK